MSELSEDIRKYIQQQSENKKKAEEKFSDYNKYCENSKTHLERYLAKIEELNRLSLSIINQKEVRENAKLKNQHKKAKLEELKSTHFRLKEQEKAKIARKNQIEKMAEDRYDEQEQDPEINELNLQIENCRQAIDDSQQEHEVSMRDQEKTLQDKLRKSHNRLKLCKVFYRSTTKNQAREASVHNYINREELEIDIQDIRKTYEDYQTQVIKASNSYPRYSEKPQTVSIIEQSKLYSLIYLLIGILVSLLVQRLLKLIPLDFLELFRT